MIKDSDFLIMVNVKKLSNLKEEDIMKSIYYKMISSVLIINLSKG